MKYRKQAVFLLVLGCTCTIAFADTRLVYTEASFPDVSISSVPVRAEAEVDAHVDRAIIVHAVESERIEKNVASETSTAVGEPEVHGGVADVPFYSQFTDISDPAWKKIGCGIASLAMLIDFYEPAIPVDMLLSEGIAADAYLDDAGWTYAGLIGVARQHGLDGESIVLSNATTDDAYAVFEKSVREGPVMASVYYTFTPGHPIPHLVVVNGIENGTVYYNDPAEPEGGGTISEERFKVAWKKRFIVIRPQAS